MSCDNKKCTECEDCMDEEGASKEKEEEINKALMNRLTDKDKEKEVLRYIC